MKTPNIGKTLEVDNSEALEKGAVETTKGYLL
jgi:hypothetical protein